MYFTIYEQDDQKRQWRSECSLLYMVYFSPFSLAMNKPTCHLGLSECIFIAPVFAGTAKRSECDRKRN